MLKKSLFISLLLCIMITSSGCVKFKTKKTAEVVDKGGVFVTFDKGETWKQMVDISGVGNEKKNIAGLNVSNLVMDPSDSDAVYLGSETDGLYYTYDASKGWFKSESFPKGFVKAIAVDPVNKCTIYASLGSKLYKSEDCSRNWKEVYSDNESKTRINTIAIDHYNSKKLFIGTSRGEVIKSVDGGEFWRTVVRPAKEVIKVVIDPNDSRILFTGTKTKGVFKSIDGGETWVDLKENMKKLKNSNKVRDIVISKSQEDLILVATEDGLVQSSDRGEHWTRIELIVPEKKAEINSIVINPNEAKEIYYVTDTTFFKSNDGGETWASKDLPTTRKAVSLLFNPDQEGVLYLGVKLIKK